MDKEKQALDSRDGTESIRGQRRACFTESSCQQHSKGETVVIGDGTVFPTENPESGKTHFEREGVKSHVSSHDSGTFAFIMRGLGTHDCLGEE